MLPVTVPVAATLPGVIAPNVSVIAGVVVELATLPLIPFAVTTETLVTGLPLEAAVILPLASTVNVVKLYVPVETLVFANVKPIAVVPLPLTSPVTVIV